MTLYVKLIDADNPTRRSPRGEAESLDGAVEAARAICHHYGAESATIRGSLHGEPAAFIFHAEWLEEADPDGK